ncbi:MAG: GNAT family N-acetyltransferase [Candidatus Moduliflexus flocculans]|nr:GNAT family N-acetyltransferase [Candidatus Moduliflexus flocculans]
MADIPPPGPGRPGSPGRDPPPLLGLPGPAGGIGPRSGRRRGGRRPTSSFGTGEEPGASRPRPSTHARLLGEFVFDQGFARAAEQAGYRVVSCW